MLMASILTAGSSARGAGLDCSATISRQAQNGLICVGAFGPPLR